MTHDSNKPVEMLAVTQEDREAAAAVVRNQASAAMRFLGAGSGIISGEMDEHFVVQAFARHRTAAQPEREAVLKEAARQALLQIEKYAEFFCEEDFDPLVDQLRAALTTPAPTVSREEIVAVLERLLEHFNAEGLHIARTDLPLGSQKLDVESARSLLSRLKEQG